MLGSESSEARAELLAHAANGARVYVLVGPSWGKDQPETQTLQAPRALVRRVPEVPASAVHAASGARVWIGGGFALRLDEGQAEALRQSFLRLFWHEAIEEAWSGGQQFAWRAARERPFDVPEVPLSASVRRELPDARLGGELRDALLHLAGGAPPETAPRRLWFPAGPEHHDRLSKVARAGVEIVWDDRGLPDMLVGAGSGEILLPGSRGRLRVRLTKPQAGEIARLLEGDGRWRFHTDVRIGDPAWRQASFWLPGESAARGLEDEQLIEVPDVPAAELRAVPATAPASLPQPQPLALGVRYRWTVVPPRVPGGTEEDALVGRWRKLDEDWTTRLARVREALEASDGNRSRIGRAFSRLMSAMLGFERTHGALLARVTELEAQRPSAAGPADAPALLARLVEVENQTKKLEGDLAEAERKAREDEEREKQQADWQRRVAAANHELPGRRSALVEVEGQRASLGDELRAVEEELKSADVETKKDLKVRRYRLADDLKRADKEITRLGGEIKRLEHQAAEPFEFQAPAPTTSRPAQPGGRFVPPTSSARPASQVPDEALPEVGTLRSHKGQRFLVIQTWEELAAGDQAASRLSANLVAPENA
jgi:hypothetical protein